jgi:hypothetical protein
MVGHLGCQGVVGNLKKANSSIMADSFCLHREAKGILAAKISLPHKDV